MRVIFERGMFGVSSDEQKYIRIKRIEIDYQKVLIVADSLLMTNLQYFDRSRKRRVVIVWRRRLAARIGTMFEITLSMSAWEKVGSQREKKSAKLFVLIFV